MTDFKETVEALLKASEDDLKTTEIVQDQNTENGYKYFDKFTSWLKFNWRVAHEGTRVKNPILERLNFIGIADDNLDEFIRTKFDKSKNIKRLISNQTNYIEAIYDNLKEVLRTDYDIDIASIDDIRNCDKAYNKLHDEFKKNLYPMIQPLILTSELPMPLMSDGASFIITKIMNDTGEEINCIIKLPETTLIKVKCKSELAKNTYITSDEIIEEFISDFYRGKKIISHTPIRVLRQIESLCANESGYISGIKRQIKNREKAQIMMVDTSSDLSEYKGLFKNSVKKRKRKYVYGLSYLKSIKDYISHNDAMVYKKNKPRIPIDFVSEENESIFDILSEKNVLVHFPYESFNLSTVRFLEEAANDPNVISIRQTLYRVGENSPLIKALLKAANNGKQVVVLLELKAKMDEKNNLELTEKLKNAGCDVIFGPIELKIHAKITLVVRKEGDKLAKYANISTGNFNDKTAKIYEDISYFTKESNSFKVGNDLLDLFNYLGGYSNISDANNLLISPFTFRKTIEEKIQACINSKKMYPNENVSINIKCNSFTDTHIADLLYEASKVGVKVNCIIRGMCMLIPGVEGMSDNIQVKSIIGRYLEHSRLYQFNYYTTDGEQMNLVRDSFLGSGDIMPRNLDYRIEVITPIKKKNEISQISKIFDDYNKDTVNSYTLLPTGNYTYPKDELSSEDFSVQDNYIKIYKKAEKNIIK